MELRDALWIGGTLLASIASFALARVVFAEEPGAHIDGEAVTTRRQPTTPQARAVPRKVAPNRHELVVRGVPEAWIDRLDREPVAAERVRAAVIETISARTPGVAECVTAAEVADGVDLRFVVDIVSTADQLVVGDAEYIHASVGPPLSADAEACIEERLRGRDVVTAAGEAPFLDYIGPVDYLLVIGG